MFPGWNDEVPTMHSVGGAPRRNSPQTHAPGSRNSADVELFLSAAHAPTAQFVMLDNGGSRVDGDLMGIIGQLQAEVSQLRVVDAAQNDEIAVLRCLHSNVEARMQALEKGMKRSGVEPTVIPEEETSEPGGCGKEADAAGCPL